MNATKQTTKQSRFDFGDMAATYDRWYETPEGKAHDWVQKRDALHFLSSETPGRRLLDVGCGTGHWSLFFAEQGYNVMGVDVSTEQLRQAQRHSREGLRFQHGDLCASLPFDANAFDVVAAMAVIEFVFSPLRALREMARCVKKDGRLLVGALNRSASLNRRRLIEGREPYVSGNLHSQDELLRLLSSFGKVRMIGSDPEGLSYEQAARDFSFRVGNNAPFIIAEVQR